MIDVRAALRLLWTRPGFCASVVLTLAIALGATTAIFSLVHALILRPLPFEAPDRLIVINAVVGVDAGHLALREYRELERSSRTIAGYAAYYRSQYNVTGGGPPEALTCTIASSTLFHTLGVKPLHGEVWPSSQDFTRQFQILLSHRVWQQRFGGRPDVVGRLVQLDGHPYRVAGVLPAGFDYPLQTDVFRSVTDYDAEHVRRLSVVARLRPGHTLQEAQAELDAFSARFAGAYPDTNQGVRLRATLLRDAYVGRARPFVLLLFGAVALLLLIACVNVANLFLSRAVSQQPDFAVRLALGAGRLHLVRQSGAETLLLASIGAVLGIAIARWGLAAITALVHADLPPWFTAHLDPTVLLCALALALIVAAVVGAVPALHAARTDLELVMRQDSARAIGGRRQQVARRLLVGGQAALATVLLLAAGTFVSALGDLAHIDPGFDRRHVLTFRADPPFSRYPDIATTAEFYRRATEQIALLPGVVAAGTNARLPFSRLDNASPRIWIEGRSTGRPDEAPFVNFQLIDPGYFAAMGIAVRNGRAFTRRDTPEAPLVAIVNQRAARRFWGLDDPIGRRVRVVWNNQGTGGGGGSELWLTVVGVVGNVRFTALSDEAALDIYAPNMQLFAGDSYFVIRTAVSPDALLGELRRAIDRVDPEQSFFDVQSMQARVDASIWQHRVATFALGVFAAIALTLAIVGTYAVTAHAVAAQHREIGIRMALGSAARDVTWLVLRQWITPVVAGTGVGLVAGRTVTSGLAALLGVDSGGNGLAAPLVFAALQVTAAVVACALPVRRAVRRVELAQVLRGD